MIYLRKSWERLCDEYASRGSFGARVKGKKYERRKKYGAEW